MTYHSESKEKMKAHYFTWCNTNGLRFSATPHGSNYYKILKEVMVRGKWKGRVGEIIYTKNPKAKEPKWWEAIHDLYESHYKTKNNKDATKR